MTIKELEQATGMTRANIRFYEQEGLLSPARSPNGYRDYSGEELHTLERIRLLRALHLDLETIRALQRGEVSLPETLEGQLKRLEADQAALSGAKAVCLQLREQGVEYGTLEAGPWLERLKNAPASERFSPPKDELPAPGHPWRRYFARSLDLALYGLFLIAAKLLVLHIPPWRWGEGGILATLLDSYLRLGLMLLLEPLMLAYWGTTPGKALFGIRLRNAEGERFTLEQARERTWKLFGKGLGYGIPIYELWRTYQSYTLCKDRQWEPWQTGYRREPEQMEIPDELWRCFAYVGARAGTVILAAGLLLQSFLPPCRSIGGEQDFYDNYNFYAQQVYPLLTYGADELQESGHGSVYSQEWGPVGGQWRILLDAQGKMAGFRCEARGEPMLIHIAAERAGKVGLLAWAGGMEEWNLLSFRIWDWLGLIPGEAGSYDISHRGVHIKQQIRYLDGEAVSQLPALWEDSRPMELELILTYE